MHFAVVALLVLVGGVLADAEQPSGPAAPESFNDATVMERWSFSNGPEWPGARGSLKQRGSGGHGGDGALVLTYDFEQGGNYVAAIVDLPDGPAVRAVRLWVNKPADNLMTFRALDSSGESFQKSLRFEFDGWQQLEIALAGWTYSCGGDGVFDGPPRQFHILIENQGRSRRGDLLIDDVQWLFSDVATSGDDVASATFTESTFADSDGWSTHGSAGSSLTGQSWRYHFDGSATETHLHWGKSILGRPKALRLTVISDGSGHTLGVICGSHFQGFKRTLGVLDEPGERTFEVPMGDMTSWQHFGGENDGIVRYPLRLGDIMLRKTGPQAEGAVTLIRLEFVTQYDRRRPVTIIPAVSRDDQENAVFKAELRSLHSAPLAGVVRYAFKTTEQTLERGSAKITIPSGGRARFERVASLGAHQVLEGEFEFVSEQAIAGPQSITIGQPPPAPADYAPNPGSRMGVGMYLYRYRTHPDRKAWMERMCRLAAAAGVKWTREEFNWNWIEPRQGEFDFSFYDELVDTALAHGISVYGLAAYWTEWNHPPVTDEFIENYCRYLRALVGRYGDRIKHWEIWNEPNIFFWPDKKERYPVLLKRAYAAIKDAAPDAEVLGCSTAGIDRGFVEMVLQHGAPFDALTVHPYRQALDAPGFIKELRETSALVDGRDIWITEMGWPSHIGGLSERAQAGYVARTYIAALAAPAVRTVAWYDFREDGADPFYNEHHFGLVRQDLTPKIAYHAVAAVGRLLGTAECIGALDLERGLRGYQFRDGPRWIAALWSPDDTCLAKLALKPAGARVLNTLGEPAALCNSDRGAILRLEQGLPVYILSAARLEVRVPPPPLTISVDRPSVHPGERVRVAWQSDTDVTVGTPILPGGWTSSQQDAEDGIGVIPPETTPRGTYIIQVPVTCDEMPTEVPIIVKIVPRLLRG